MGSSSFDFTFSGSGNQDQFHGTGGNDLLDGRGGNDELTGAGGDDCLLGAGGNDLLDGGQDDDELNGGGGNDILLGRAGNDVIVGGAGNDTIEGGAGRDTVNGGRGNDVIDGGMANDTLRGGRDGDVIDGGEGDDLVSGGAGSDQLQGGEGDDTVLGGSGTDVLDGGEGHDDVDGGRGNDRLIFEYVDGELFDASSGPGDCYDGGTGFDTLEIRIRGDILADPTVAAELAALEAAIEAGDQGPIEVASLGLTVKNVEQVKIETLDLALFFTADGEDGNTGVYRLLSSDDSPVLVHDFGTTLFGTEAISAAYDGEFFIAFGGGRNPEQTAADDLFRFTAPNALPILVEAPSLVEPPPAKAPKFDGVSEMVVLEETLYVGGGARNPSATLFAELEGADASPEFVSGAADDFGDRLAFGLTPFGDKQFLHSPGEDGSEVFRMTPGAGATEVYERVDDLVAPLRASFIVYDDALFLEAQSGVDPEFRLHRVNSPEDLTADVVDAATFTGKERTTFIEYDGSLFITGQSATQGLELFRLDGADDETLTQIDLLPGPESSNSLPLIAFDGSLFVVGNTAAQGRELFRLDSATDTTPTILDINPGIADSRVGEAIVFDGSLYFTAVRDDVGEELFRLDSASDTTPEVIDIAPDAPSSSPEQLTLFDGSLFFSARPTEGSNDALLHRLDPGSDTPVVVGEDLIFADRGGIAVWDSEAIA